MAHPELLFIFFIIAFIYSSVGFGGGSSYLAILALYAFPFHEIRLTALVCNIIVVTGGTLLFIKNKQTNWKKMIPLAVASVPMAFIGATLRLSEDVFYIILGISLLLAGALLWIKTSGIKEDTAIKDSPAIARDAAIGGGIGFLSGMVGIGGGIFLSPLLNLTKWDTARHIAATASFFILVNSVSGIAGQLTNLPHKIDAVQLILLCTAVFAGGQLGSRVGVVRFNALAIRRVTAILVFIAGNEVLFKHLPWFK